jgi:hypothetical protein
MARMLILSCTPLMMLALGGWWRRFDTYLCPQTGPEPGPPGEVPLAQVVRDVLWRLDDKAARQFSWLEMAVEEDLKIGGDRQALEELLSALCLHAIQTTPCGRVLVTARRHGSEMAVTIADDGIGIAIARASEVMERAREMLSLLGGSIEIERRQGIGTTATIRLPAHTAPWNATIQNAMADFARVTAPRERTPSEPAVAAYPS